MATTALTRTCIAAIAALAACGGPAFTTGDGAVDSADATADVAHSDAAARRGVLCGILAPCNGNSCCIGTSSGPSCTGGSCSCGTSLLACASDANCAGLTPVCCIRSVADSCGSNHDVAMCAAACLQGSSRLCDPIVTATCPNGRQCSTNADDLSSVGLPANIGYGVCK